MPTISDVARSAGVSVATVSRVLNQSLKVKTATRERVLQAIESLQYAPDASAKALRSRRTNLIGVVIPDVSSIYYLELLKGIENTAIERGYNLIICDAQNSADRENEYMKLLSERRSDGLILINPLMPDAHIDRLARQGFPLVLIGRESKSGNVTSIVVQNQTGARQAMDHLIKHGHKRIAYIRGMQHPDDEERFATYRAVLEEYSLGYDPQLVERGHFTEEGGARAFQRLAQRAKFTAVFAANDEMAVGAMEKAREAGLAIPKDLAVVGFDNIRLARHITPGLTTADMPKYQLGATAAKKLLGAMADDDIAYEKVVFRTELVIRQSCGCP
ncbi:MAG: LacI family DNA-binding transcriptional regulator [Patescibacteria group bacterium]